MRNSKSLAAAVALTVLLAAVPMHAAPRFTRDLDPITRFMKYVKKVFGDMTSLTTISIPTP